SRHGFEVLRRKPWQSHPGGEIFELTWCPFNPDHKDGSAAFTLVNGRPGFTCKHDGCHGKTIKEVFAIFTTADSTPEEEQERKTQAQILCELATKAELFHTTGSEAYAHIPVSDHLETWSLRSKGFKRWLIREFYTLRGKPPGSQALQDAI